MLTRHHSAEASWTAAAIAVTTLCSSASATANGRYPLANQVVTDPVNADHLVARATFGILDSHDAGRTWTWICEDALGSVAQGEDPALGVTADGSTIVAFSQGISISQDGCSWKGASGLPGGRFAVDVAVNPLRPHEALAIESIPAAGAYYLYVVRTVDDGATWTDVGAPLGGFLGTTVEIAPTNPDRVYVSGKLVASQASVIQRSDDGGQTFTPFTIGGIAPSVSPYIGAIDPNDPDVVYLRVPPGAAGGGQVLASADGGATFRQLSTIAGDIAGFALSPDGSTLAIGGPESGLYLGRTNDGIFETVGTIKPTCLTWNGARIFACAKEAVDSFSIGESTDGGAHFTPVLVFPNIVPRACPAASSAGSCGAQWSQIATAIGADAGEGRDADASSSGQGATPPPTPRGCGCALTGEGGIDRQVLGTMFFAAAVAARRRHRRNGVAPRLAEARHRLPRVPCPLPARRFGQPGLQFAGMKVRQFALFSVAFLGACADVAGLATDDGAGVVPLSDSGSGVSMDSSSSADGVEPFCPPPESDMCNGAAPSYASDIAPILDKRCNDCHAENSDGGPWPLGGYDDVSAWRDTIMNDLLRCTMPPADAGVPIPNAERAILMAWIICGTPNN